MNKTNFKLHPVAVLYMLRSYWYIFTAPFIRIIIQNVFFDRAARLLLSEKMILLLTSIYVILKWLRTDITVKNDKITINKGLLVKSYQVIKLSHVLSITTKQNILDILTGCATCCFNVEINLRGFAKNTFKIRARDTKALLIAAYGDTKTSKLKIKRQKRRYFTIPCLLIAVTAVLMSIIGFFYQNTQRVMILTVMLLMIEFCYVLFCYVNFKRSNIFIGDVIYAQGTSAFGLYSICCYKSKVETVKISQSLIDKRHNTCKIHLLLYVNRGRRLKIKNADLYSAKEKFDWYNND